jgi:hypothetical protein
MIKKRYPETFRPSGKGSDRGIFEPEEEPKRPPSGLIELAGNDYQNQCRAKEDGTQCARKKEPDTLYCKKHRGWRGPRVE